MQRAGRLVWIVVATVALTGRAAAEPPPGAIPLTPDEAVRIALEQHPLARAAAEAERAAEADHGVASSGWLPRVEVSEDVVRSTNPVFVFASKLGQEIFGAADFDPAGLNNPDALTNAATRFTVRQNIWDAGRTGVGQDATRLGIDAARETRRRSENEIAYRALQAFFGLAVADAGLDVAREAEAAAAANARLAAERVDAGAAVPSDRMAADVRLAEVQAQRIRAEEGREVADATLLAALGLEAGGPYAPLVPELDPGSTADTVEQLVGDALARRPDLVAFDRRIEQAESGVRFARSRRYPEIGAIGQYELNADTPFGADGSNWTVGLGIKLTVFDGLETDARLDRTRADVAQARAMREALRQGIRLEVRAAWAARESARRRLAVAEAAMASAEEALRIVRERYGEGVTLIVDLLGAEAAHAQAQSNLVAARGDLWLARAGLDLATGASPWSGADSAE